MSFNINKLINSITKMAEANEDISLPNLSAKLSKAAEERPYDQTIMGMTKVISSLANKKYFISKAELKDLYNKFYTRNNKFAEYCDELGDINQSAPTLAPKNEAPISSDIGYLTDPILSNALNAAFGNEVPLKTFSKDIAQAAKKAVAVNLDNWNLKASKLEVGAGNDYFIVVKADYETPKGLTSVLVPVEVRKGKALEPVVFMANAGPQDLNHTNIKSYITSNAGVKLQIRANDVIDVLTRAVVNNVEISDAELALTRFNATKESVGGFSDILGLKVAEKITNFEVKTPKLAESDLFAEKFNNPTGVANFKFGKENINIGRDVIARQLTGYGIKNPQISVFSCDETSVFYAVSINAGRTAFKVPVKFSSNRIVNPDMLLCNGSILPFTKQSINKLAADDASDFKVAAVASPQFSLTASDLVQNVRSAVDEGNYAKAEDALNILQQKDDAAAYVSAFAIYTNGLSGKKTASEQTKCCLIVKSANSQHPVCGHTGLPVHKVYQDDHGNCHPLYRRGMDESYEGAFFMNYKIFG